ncbi:MAG: AAA family ATPase [Pseudanabaena sp.]|jgi:predicted ATP-dependent endonuclease of OLD family
MEDKIRYKEILLPSEEPFLNYSVGKSKLLEPLSLVNIFIGSNNCGKSRLIRSLFSLKFLRYKTNKYDATDCYSLLQKLDREFQFVFTNTHPNVKEVGGISIKYIEEKLQTQDKNFIDCNNPIHKVIEEILQTLIEITETTVKKEALYANPIKFISKNFKKEFDKLNIDLKLGSERRYYIPSLRGMRPLLEDQNISYKNRIKKEHNVYENRTKKDYFGKDTLLENMKIFTGLELYQTLKEKLLGEPNERKQVKEFEEFLSENFFENKEVTLIPREKEPKVVHIKIGEEPQFPIYNLGDGLQNLIICTFNIFMEKERCLFFIEEPDMFMHPSMQRAFLEVLSKVDRHQYFITSHSNHFLDMTIDFANISVFHFSKHEDTQPQFHIRPSSPRDRQILLDLGVRNSSVFISNATIWVEGITDRLYLKAYMKKYIDELELSEPEKYSELIKLKEDYHYSFVEYQGANLTHWSFDPDEDDDEYKIRAKSICGHAFLIADGDIGSHLKGDRKAVYEKMLGERFLVLQVKEIENLIPVEILKKVVAEKFKKYEGNIERIKYKDYAKPDTPIGRYLDRLLKAIPEGKTIFAAINKSKSKSEGSGTIKSKSPFCDDAIRFMQNSEWTLTDDLKDICVNIFKHIITQNKNS